MGVGVGIGVGGRSAGVINQLSGTNANLGIIVPSLPKAIRKSSTGDIQVPG